MQRSLIILLILNTVLTGQYAVKSPYLIDPDKAIGYVDSSAAFWQSAWDNTYGGFYTNVAKNGQPLTSWGTNKNMISQSRNAYGMVRAYMLTGNHEYLTRAQEALQFMYSSAWDENNGGWFNNISRTGSPGSPAENKTAFNQHYALLGISAYYEATYDTSALNWLMKGYENNEEKLWDNRVNYFGYYDYGNYNWTTTGNKSFNATVDAITTHALYLYLMTKQEQYKDKMLKITDNIMSYLVPSMDAQAIGFAEEYNSDWEIRESETMTIMGHVLKTAWCLARVYHYQPDPAYLIAAEKLADDVLEKGYDHEFGGPYKDYNRKTGEMLMWGNPDTAKAWWQMEQAVVAGLQLYQVTGENKYLQMADETLDFFMKYFVDHVYGEVYENRTRYGEETWGEHKGNGAKAAYHSIELGYYTYLYGNLFYAQEPVTLYYNFTPLDYNRDILMNPLALADSIYKITGVTLNGEAYNNFMASERVLNLPSDTGGEFAVTFELTDSPVNITEGKINLQPESFVLHQNYPNPFNPITVIEYSIPRSVNSEKSIVNMKVYDVLGREAATLVNKQQNPGSYTASFDGSNLSSGTYIYRLTAGSFAQSRKMILLR